MDDNNRNLNRRDFLKGLGITIVGGALLSQAFLESCKKAATTSSTTNPGTTTGPATTTSQPFAGTTLNVFMMAGQDAGIAALLPDFQAQTGITVKITTASMGDLQTKLGTEFAAGGSSYDVAGITWEWAQGYARSKYLYELDDFINKYKVDMTQYMDVYTKNHMVQYPETASGKYINLPHVADVHLFAYRKDLFNDTTEQANFKAKYGYALKVPETYQELLDVAHFFTRPDSNLYGTTIMGKNHPATLGDISAFIRGFGGDLIDSNFKPIINNAKSLAGEQYYYDLFAKEKVTPPAANTYAWDEENADFQNGKIAMMNVWPGSVTKLEDPVASKVAGKIGYAVVPGKAPVLGGWCMTIPAKAKSPEASFLFIKWLTSTDTAIKRAEATGFAAAVNAIFTNSVMNQKFPYLQAFKDNSALARGWPQIAEVGSIWNIGASEFSQMFAGQLTVQQAADGAYQQIDTLMRAGGYYT